MSDITLNLLRQDTLGGGRPKSIDYYYDGRDYNVNQWKTLYLIDSSLSGNAGTLSVGDHDHSKNGHKGIRGSLFKGSTAGDSDGFRSEVEVKYNRQWGSLIGHTAVPSTTTNKAWLLGVKGIEFDWRLYCEYGYISLKHLGIVYGNALKNSSRLFYMPLIYDKKIYSGAKQNYTGYNLNDQKSSNWNKSRDGRVALRGNTTMCNAVDDKKLVMLGMWYSCYQEKKSDSNRQTYAHFFNGKPLFHRDGLGSNYKAILPYKAYPFSEACNGYMAIG